MKKNNESFFKLKSNDDGDGNGNPPASPHATALPAEKFANIQVELNEMESTI